MRWCRKCLYFSRFAEVGSWTKGEINKTFLGHIRQYVDDMEIKQGAG
jgi:hypothetical protein